MKAIIVDDEREVRVHLKQLLDTYCKNVTIVAEAASADEGASAILLHEPDLVFLDVQMPKRSGFDMLRTLGQPEFAIIFVTGDDRYAVDAFKFSALDYLLKPVEPADLLGAVAKAFQHRSRKQLNERLDCVFESIENPSAGKQDKRIALISGSEQKLVFLRDIKYLEAAKHYSQVHLEGGQKILDSRSIGDFEDLLSSYQFIQCHKSWIVNRKYIKSLRKVTGGNELLLHGGDKIPVSDRKLLEVKDELKKIGL